MWVRKNNIELYMKTHSDTVVSGTIDLVKKGDLK